MHISLFKPIKRLKPSSGFFFGASEFLKSIIMSKDNLFMRSDAVGSEFKNEAWIKKNLNKGVVIVSQN